MRSRGLSTLIDGIWFSMIVLGVAVVLGGCDADGGSSSGGYAPSSLVGKTMKINKWRASVTFSTSSDARLSFGSCIGTCAESGSTTYSYAVTGPDSARFKLSYGYTEKSAVPKENSKTTGDFDLALDFTSENYGTANGSQSYTFVNYESNKTTNTSNVLSDSPFTLTGS
jgi:hypothetical protein